MVGDCVWIFVVWGHVVISSSSHGWFVEKLQGFEVWGRQVLSGPIMDAKCPFRPNEVDRISCNGGEMS